MHSPVADLMSSVKIDHGLVSISVISWVNADLVTRTLPADTWAS